MSSITGIERAAQQAAHDERGAPMSSFCASTRRSRLATGNGQISRGPPLVSA